MMAGTEKGKEVRRYFLDVGKRRQTSEPGQRLASRMKSADYSGSSLNGIPLTSGCS
jgi:hypothetical protein